jgi:hypothetical protein
LGPVGKRKQYLGAFDLSLGGSARTGKLTQPRSLFKRQDKFGSCAASCHTGLQQVVLEPNHRRRSLNGKVFNGTMY